MRIEIANIDDFTFLDLIDNHISEKELLNSISLKRIYMMYDDNTFVGTLRYNLFWDNTPFINFLRLTISEQTLCYPLFPRL